MSGFSDLGYRKLQIIYPRKGQGVVVCVTRSLDPAQSHRRRPALLDPIA
jgi:hypothetical protein